MHAKQLAVSALALFGLFTLLSSLAPFSPPAETTEPHGLVGCDPGIPPIPLSGQGAVPLNFYNDATSASGQEDYVVSFFPPKTMAVEMRDGQGTEQVPFKPKTLHEVTFHYDTNAGTMKLTLDPDVDTAGDETVLANVPYFGKYDANGEVKPGRLIEIPHDAVNKKRLMFVVQFKGLIAAFQISDQ